MSSAVLISGSLVGTRELIRELGADPTDLAHQAGLTPRLFEDPDIFVQAERITDFFELAARACQCPDFGLRHAHRLPMGIFWQIWMGMRTAPNIRAGLETWVRSYGLYTDGGSFVTESCAEGMWMSYSFLALGRFGINQTVNLTLGAVCLFIAENLGRSWVPKRVHLRAQPSDPEPFVEFFGPGVSFGEDRDAVLIDNQTLNQTMLVDNVGPNVRRNFTAHHLGKGPAVVTQVRSLLPVFLRHEQCSVESIAHALGTSERTLQRRLGEEQTNFRTLVDSVRADLAWRHVHRTDLSIALVAELLGYDSQTAFSRAFRRWHKINPRAARKQGLDVDQADG